jgi:hypothetical protein
MKIKLAIFILFCSVTSLYAQIDGSDRPTNIIGIDTSANAKTNLPLKITPLQRITNKENRPRLNYTPLTNYFKPTSGLSMTSKSNLIKPTWNIKQKFGEGHKDISKFKRDHYLGDLYTKSKYIRIKCRDHEYVDGDRIKLFLNKAVIHPNITLTGTFYIIDIELNEGLNTIEFEALNEGLSSPNTAELKVYDEHDVLLSSNRWLITTGYRARLMISRQKN